MNLRLGVFFVTGHLVPAWKGVSKVAFKNVSSLGLKGTKFLLTKRTLSLDALA